MLNWLKNLFRKKEEEEDFDLQELNIFAVIEGPHLVPDTFGSVCLVVLYYTDIPEEAHCTDLYFLDFETAYQFKKHVDGSATPVVVVLPKGADIQEDTEWRKRL